MKRLRTILLFLLLGAVMSIAVAWSLALLKNNFYVPGFPYSQHSSSEHGDCWSYLRYEYFGTTRLLCTPTEQSTREFRDSKYPYARPPRWSITNDPPSLFLVGEASNPKPVDYWQWKVFSRVEIARGWPFRMMYRRQYSPNPSRIIRDEGAFLIRAIPSKPAESIAIPLYIYWPGFAFNTLFYGGLFWLLIPGPFVLRRHLRSKRGLCMKCAYDLKGAVHAVCPECGADIVNARPV